MKRIGGGAGLAAAAMATLACVVIPTRGGSVVVVSDEETTPSATSSTTTTTAATAKVPSVAAYAVGSYLLPRLDEVVARLEDRRRALPLAESPQYSAAAWRLVAEGAGEVVEALDTSTAAAEGVEDDDLAPLRDYVRWAEERALDELRRQAGGLLRPTRAVSAVSRGSRGDVRPAQRADVDGLGPIEIFLAAIRQVRDRAAVSDLQTDLCVISEPSRGRFHVFPASAPSRGRETIAVGVIANLWRGRYVLEVEVDGVPHEQPNIDLVSPDRLTLLCVRDSRGVGCSEQSGLLSVCSER
jgi:hypothetical protein